MQHHVIYVPGLGDHRSHGQELALRYWRIFGLHAQYFALEWRKTEGFDAKLTKLINKIDNLVEQGHKVSLCGTSAGASAVLAAYALRPDINGVITIAGKIYRPETIKQQTRDENPDFYEAAKRIEGNLDQLAQRDDLKNILCIYAGSDKTVSSEDAIIPGGSKYAVAGWDHGSGIFFGVTLGAPAIARFLKSRSR